MDLRELPHATQQRHPWEMARLDYFSSILDRHLETSNSNYRHLDVGAGDAWLVSSLLALHRAISEAVAWDTGYEHHAVRSKVAERVQSVSLVSRQPKGIFDLVTLLDVLEHVDEPEPFLKGIVCQNVSADGYVLVSVPA